MNTKKYLKYSHKTLAWILFIWIILFEFILPSNNFLPKPSIVLLSFTALVKDYHLFRNISITISEIYLSMFVAYYVSKIFFQYLGSFNFFLDAADSIYKFFKFLPVIIPGIFLIFWIPNSNYTGFIFAFLISLTAISAAIKEESLKVKHEYVDSAISLGAKKNIIARDVIWNGIQPNLLDFIFQFHYFLWLSLLLFEFINGGFGIGAIYKSALQYRDLSSLFSISVIVGIIIFLGFLVLKYLRRKFFHWSNI